MTVYRSLIVIVEGRGLRETLHVFWLNQLGQGIFQIRFKYDIATDQCEVDFCTVEEEEEEEEFT